MTGLNSNIDELIARLKTKKAVLASTDFSQALLLGVNAAKGQMQFRIFNNRLDADGASLGKYVPGPNNRASTLKKLKRSKKRAALIGDNKNLSPYMLKRVKKGRQIEAKDLEFYGDLRRGIKVVKESNRKVNCLIPNEKLLKIANGQEEQIARINKTGKEKVRIFGLSIEERELLKTQVNAALNQIYVRIFST